MQANRHRGSWRTTAAMTVVIASAAVGLTNASPADASPNLYYAAEHLLRDNGGDTGFSVYSSSQRSIFGMNHGAYVGGSHGSLSPAAVHGGVAQLNNLLYAATGYDASVPAGASAIGAMITSLDKNLGTVSGGRYTGLKQVMYNIQRTQVGGHDELRRKLLTDCATCVRAGVLIAAVSGGVLTNIALNNVPISSIAKLGVDAAVAAVIAVALIAVTQFDHVNANTANQRVREIIRASTTTLITYLTGVLQGHTTTIDNHEGRISDLENQLRAARHHIATLERDRIHRQGQSFLGRLWGT